jgi:hypothetical protein
LIITGVEGQDYFTSPEAILQFLRGSALEHEYLEWYSANKAITATTADTTADITATGVDAAEVLSSSSGRGKRRSSSSGKGSKAEHATAAAATSSTASRKRSRSADSSVRADAAAGSGSSSAKGCKQQRVTAEPAVQQAAVASTDTRHDMQAEDNDCDATQAQTSLHAAYGLADLAVAPAAPTDRSCATDAATTAAATASTAAAAATGGSSRAPRQAAAKPTAAAAAAAAAAKTKRRRTEPMPPSSTATSTSTPTSPARKKGRASQGGNSSSAGDSQSQRSSKQQQQHYKTRSTLFGGVKFLLTDCLKGLPKTLETNGGVVLDSIDTAAKAKRAKEEVSHLLLLMLTAVMHDALQ